MRLSGASEVICVCHCVRFSNGSHTGFTFSVCTCLRPLKCVRALSGRPDPEVPELEAGSRDRPPYAAGPDHVDGRDVLALRREPHVAAVRSALPDWICAWPVRWWLYNFWHSFAKFFLSLM